MKLENLRNTFDEIGIGKGEIRNVEISLINAEDELSQAFYKLAQIVTDSNVRWEKSELKKVHRAIAKDMKKLEKYIDLQVRLLKPFDI